MTLPNVPLSRRARLSPFSFALSLILPLVVAPVLVACSPAGDEPVRPGDEVGGFLITTGDTDQLVDSLVGFDQLCQRDGDELACTVPPGIPYCISFFFHGDTAADLDARWAAAGYEITIEDRPVDLEAFGALDFPHPDTGWFMRAWNVVVQAAEPAELVIRHAGVVEGEAFDQTTTLTVRGATPD